MKQKILTAAAVALVAGVSLSTTVPGVDARPNAKPATGVELSVTPGELTVTGLPCLPGQLEVAMTNTGSEPVFADTVLGAAKPITLSDTVFSSYLPAADPDQRVAKTFEVQAPRGTAAGTYDITVTTGERGHEQTKTVPVTVTAAPQPGPGTNLAYGEQAIASSTHGNFQLCGPVDGDREDSHWEETGWNDGTRAVFPDWWGVQWEGPQTIDRVEFWTKAPGETNGIRDFEIQVRDGEAWRTVAEQTGNDQIHVVTTFPAQRTDAVRILITDAGSNYSRLLEFEVYGPAT
ncbi:discoidin domain-containing protein [Propionibacteriaceae bacterium Y2011]